MLHLDGGIDYRLRQLEQAPTYLDSTLPDTAAQLRQRFAALAGAAASGPADAARSKAAALPRSRTGAGMAWFEFSELCEGPRSQNDYIELAHSYHTIFISNIPNSRAADEDAARRFIMLIDEFYDRGVKIVVSAAAAPAGAVSRRATAARIPARREPPRRNADAALPRRSTPSLKQPSRSPGIIRA